MKKTWYIKHFKSGIPSGSRIWRFNREDKGQFSEERKSTSRTQEILARKKKDIFIKKIFKILAIPLILKCEQFTEVYSILFITIGRGKVLIVAFRR